jgi:hypothetical protein
MKADKIIELNKKKNSSNIWENLFGYYERNIKNPA